MDKRYKEAVKIKRGLLGLEITEEICPNLKEFSKLLNEWAKEGKFKKGRVQLPEVKKVLKYELYIHNSKVWLSDI